MLFSYGSSNLSLGFRKPIIHQTGFVSGDAMVSSQIIETARPFLVPKLSPAQYFIGSQMMTWFFFPKLERYGLGQFEHKEIFPQLGGVIRKGSFHKRSLGFVDRNIFVMKPGYISLWLFYRRGLNASLDWRFRRHFRLSKWANDAAKSSLNNLCPPIESLTSIASVDLTNKRLAVRGGCKRNLSVRTSGPLALASFRGVCNFTYNWNYALY